MRTLLTYAALLLMGCGNFGSMCSVRPSIGKVTAVNAGTDLNVDAGMAKCSFSGYAWACETCNVVEIPIGTHAKIDGESTKHQWVSPTSAATFAEPHKIQTMVNFSPGSPPQAGCITPSYPVELRVLDVDGVLHSDRFTVTVNCCGS